MSYSLPKESKFKIYISALTQLNVDEHNRISTTDGRLIRRMVRDNRTRGTQCKRNDRYVAFGAQRGRRKYIPLSGGSGRYVQFGADLRTGSIKIICGAAAFSDSGGHTGISGSEATLEVP